jgi:hypothetical protein
MNLLFTDQHPTGLALIHGVLDDEFSEAKHEAIMDQRRASVLN